MTGHIQFLLLGLGSGAVFAALALALVVIYRSSGVVHFATGSVALCTAYIYAFLRKGKLLILIPGFPRTTDIGADPGFWAALTISLAIAALFGGGMYLVIFRPLRSAPPVARTVASIGVMVVLTAIAVARVGTAPIGVKPIFPADSWTLGEIILPQDRVWFALTILIVALALATFYRFTPFGLATRAAAQSEKGACVSGLSPDRIAACNWMIGTAVAGLSGILIAPIVPLAPTSYTLFIVPALAAAILGNFSSVAGAVLAGLVIGMLQSEALYLKGELDWLPASGLAELIPLLLIVALLIVRARGLPTRGAPAPTLLGHAPRPARIWLTATILGLGTLATLTLTSGEWRVGIISSLIAATLALSQVVVTGYAGQVSLAQLALAGAAGFLISPLATSSGIPFPLTPLVAATGAALLGVIVGLPALRVRGLTVAIVTLALAYALEAVWFRNGDIAGAAGLHVPAPEVFGLNLAIGSGTAYPRLHFAFLCLAVLLVTGIAVAHLRRSRLGAQMLAVRAGERAAAASGINVVRTKLVAFGIGGFIAGLAGCLMAYQQTSVSFESFAALAGLGVFATVYLAGITSVTGGLLAGLISAGGIVFLSLEKLVGNADWYQCAIGAGLVLTILLNPEGLARPLLALTSRQKTPAAHQSLKPSAHIAAGPPPATAESTPAALALDNVTVRYGGVTAVDGVSLTVAAGSIVGLIGPNGAGKTTLLDAISGFAPASGLITLGPRPIERFSADRRARSGLGRTFQAVELYDDLTVRENVRIGQSAQDGRGGLALAEILDLLDIAELAHTPAGQLSHGQRQLVSIARALAGHPDVLLLDEPAGGLDSSESRWLADRLRAVRDSGVTVVLVEHDMNLVLSVCDHVHVLNFGTTLASGSPSQIRCDEEVIAAYLGDAHAEALA